MPLIPVPTVKSGYRSQSEDTSIEADVLYFSALREKPQPWRAERFISFNQATRRLGLSAIQNQSPGSSMRREYVRRRLGEGWSDVLGVLKLQGERLDFEYLWHLGSELGLAEALDQAFREARL